MPIASETQTIFERGWIIRVRPTHSSPPKQVCLMIHGWTGDEGSMEVFARGLTADSLVFFPRGPIPAPGGGYGWVQAGETIATYASFVNPAQALMAEIDLRLRGYSGMDFGRLINVVGFSQGAALAYTLALLYPQRIRKLAGLAGFLPALAHGFSPPDLPGLQVYIAHGRKDQTIPIERATEAAKIFTSAGAEVEFCENEAGHKLPANCFSDLTRFLNR